jgi:transcriptional regulator of acetoin/glycerol metabolism/DNA-binding CsgD family transcriptional regulator
MAVSRHLRRAMARFVDRGEIPGDVRDEIVASWQRSRASGLHPETVSAPFEPDADVDDRLVRAGTAVLDRLAADLAGTAVAVVLTDADGRVIDRRAAGPALLEEMDKVSLAPGYVHAEERVGTNGIGTALAERRPVAVDGDEHFADAMTAISCAGAPITDPASGQITGVLDLASLVGDWSALMMPLVTRAAREIEQRLVDDSGVADRLVLQRFLQERRRAKGPFVIVSDCRVLTNAAADRLVAPEDESVLRECADDPEAAELQLSHGTVVSVRREPIFEGVSRRGTILRLAPVAGAPHRGLRFGMESLTQTERSVVDLVARGLTNKEAAERLFLSPHTVGFHLRSIYRKLEVNSRVDLTRVTMSRELAMLEATPA